MRALEALPFREIGRYPDLILAGLVAMLVGMLIVPLPAGLLDILLAFNICGSLLILSAALLTKDALGLSSFPTLLLITTLFRLALNISTTRGILTKGTAGDVVESFGRFVLAGDIVVGLVIFLILTLVQFMVIGKGAERVAEVGARFTLDAMPGKQMSIDAALRSGALTEEEAQVRRDSLSRESQLFGAMDGAMKFVKGDAVAGLVITAINLGAGLLIGVLRRDLPLAQALEIYSVLSVGDGLVAQIPALLITLSAGVVVTRVAPEKGALSFGHNLKKELFGDLRVIGLAGGLCVLLGLVPGLPTLPFVLTGSLFLSVVGYGLRQQALDRQAAAVASSVVREEVFAKKLADRVRAPRDSLAEQAPTVVPVSVDLGTELSIALGFDRAGEPGADCSLLHEHIPDVRLALFLDTGVRFPGIRLRSSMASLEPCRFMVRINDVPIFEASLEPNECLALEAPQRLGRLAVVGRKSRHPLFDKAEAAWIAIEDRAVVEAAGVQVLDLSAYVAMVMARCLRKHARDFVGLQEVSENLTRLERICPNLVREVVPKVISLRDLVEVLRRLVEEGISMRDFKTILEAIAASNLEPFDPIEMTEHVRASLSRQIAYAHAGTQARLPAVLLDATIEDTVREAIASNRQGSWLALDPAISRQIVEALRRAIVPASSLGMRPVVLTSVEIRRYVRKLIEPDLPHTAVLSFQELPDEVTIQPLARIGAEALDA